MEQRVAEFVDVDLAAVVVVEGCECGEEFGGGGEGGGEGREWVEGDWEGEGLGG